MTDILFTLTKNLSSTLILEIIDLESIKFYKNLGFSPSVLDLLEKNQKLKKQKREKTMCFYGDFFGAKKIIACFFHDDTLTDDRSEALMKHAKNATFLPTKDFTDAYEILTLASYSYDRFLSKKDEKRVAIFVPKTERKTLETKTQLLQAILRARDIVNQPPTETRPEALVAYIQSFQWKHFRLRVLDAKELQKIGCNLLLAVGSGSDFPPYMVVLERIFDKKEETYALIGKGVTFDAGGLQIKPDTAMLDMKCDMSGAAGVLGVAEYLDTLDELPVNIIIGLGITENVINGKAYKPLDIYRAYNGTTVEIHHTDAEGRLVLADVMSYIDDQYKPEHMITMATLTGACLYALGHDIAGIMGDDEKVIESLLKSNSPYEKVWRLPLNEKLKKSLKADIADIKNVVRSEKAGSSIGGAFLSYFQGGSKLTHLDIAGPAYRESVWGYMPKGATGWGVKILSEFLTGLKNKK